LLVRRWYIIGACVAWMFSLIYLNHLVEKFSHSHAHGHDDEEMHSH